MLIIINIFTNKTLHLQCETNKHGLGIGLTFPGGLPMGIIALQCEQQRYKWQDKFTRSKY